MAAVNHDSCTSTAAVCTRLWQLCLKAHVLLLWMASTADRARAETYELAPVADFEGLQEQLRASFRSDNCVYAVHITGETH